MFHRRFLTIIFTKTLLSGLQTACRNFYFGDAVHLPPPHRKNEYLRIFMHDEITAYYENNIFRLPAVQFAITTRCTLRCRDCSVMIPRFGRNGSVHLDMTFAQFKHALDRLTTSVDFIGTVLLLGGEPLINADLPQMVACAAENKKVGLVDIVTNCTIVPSDELICAVEDYRHKVFFGLSNYSGNIELAPALKRPHIIRILKEHDIKHTLDTGEAHWFQYELHKCSYNDEQMRAIFVACHWRFCLYFLDGLLAVCPRSLVGHKLEAFKLPDDELIDIYDANTENLRRELERFYKKDFLSACRYCRRCNEKVKPALQMNDL
jgi:MoaA/NifB/PqqE/SkfB family radical SAM enzyme